MKSTILAATLLLALGSAHAQTTAPAAATQPSALVSVTAKSGNVTVNGVAVAPGTSIAANAGDAIVVEGEATVTYSSGCVLPVTGASTLSAIPATCSTPSVKAPMGGTNVALLGVGAAAVIGAVAGGGGGDDTPPPQQPSSP